MPMRRFDPEDCEHNGPRAFVGESVPGDQPYCLDCWDPVAVPDMNTADTWWTSTPSATSHRQIWIDSSRVFPRFSSGLGSISGNTGGGYYGYRESKAALNMYMRSLAAELKSEDFICIVTVRSAAKPWHRAENHRDT